MKENWGVTVQGMLPRLKRGEMVDIDGPEFSALYLSGNAVIAGGTRIRHLRRHWCRSCS